MLWAWPIGIKLFKAFVHVMRDHDMKKTVCTHFRRLGLRGLADAIERARLVDFAKWRWSTLWKLAELVQPFIASFMEHYDPQVFSGGQAR